MSFATSVAELAADRAGREGRAVEVDGVSEADPVAFASAVATSSAPVRSVVSVAPPALAGEGRARHPPNAQALAT